MCVWCVCVCVVCVCVRTCVYDDCVCSPLQAIVCLCVKDSSYLPVYCTLFVYVTVYILKVSLLSLMI